VQFICNTTDDASLLLDGEDDSLTTPSTEYNCLSSDDIERLNALNMLRDSPNLGYDIFVEAVTTIRM
jgi:homoserine trans-succinylase